MARESAPDSSALRIARRVGSSALKRAAPPGSTLALVRLFAPRVEERISRIKLEDPRQRAEVMPHFEAARTFWKKRAEKASAP